MVRLLKFSLMLILLDCWLAPHPEALAAGALVKWVNDGDTVILSGGTKVRYLGIDAPEIAHDRKPAEPYGKEAKALNKKLVLSRRVKLELEDEKRDRYGRLLAYVFLEDGTFVNGELVRRGYAHLLRRQVKLRYWERLLGLQRQALKEKKGIWSLPVKKPEEYYLGNKRSWVFHRPHCSLGLNTTARNRVRFQERHRAVYQGFSPGRRCKP